MTPEERKSFLNGMKENDKEAYDKAVGKVLKMLGIPESEEGKEKQE